MIFWKPSPIKSSNTGCPDYEVLNNIKTAFKRNLATVPSTLGGGAHGYLGAVLTPSEYAAATPLNTPQFIEPAFPGAAAVIPPNSTGPQVSAIERQFNKALRQWTEYKNLTDAGKKIHSRWNRRHVFERYNRPQCRSSTHYNTRHLGISIPELREYYTI